MADFEKLVTVMNWEEYLDSLSDPTDCIEYMNASKHFAATLKDIIAKSTSFEQMRDELVKLAADRELLAQYGQKHLPKV